MKRTLVTLILAVLVPAAVLAQAPPAPQGSSAQPLPTYTAEQRWERAAGQATAALMALLAMGKTAGRSADETGKYLASLFGPGWPREMGPMEMARGVRRNLLLWPKAEAEALELTPTVAKLRFNRPWVPYFGNSGESYGVKVEDLERCLEVLQRSLAEERGMTFEQQREGENIIYTFRKK